MGLAGLWLWLERMVPLLPLPASGDLPFPLAVSTGEQRVHELASALVACESDRARLTVTCDEYFRDNQDLARRVKALESIIRTRRLAAEGAEVNEESGEPAALDRYLPRGGV